MSTPCKKCRFLTPKVMEVFNAINVVPIPEIPQNQLEDFFQAKAATLLGMFYGLVDWTVRCGVPWS